jgi:hypothetical protein
MADRTGLLASGTRRLSRLYAAVVIPIVLASCTAPRTSIQPVAPRIQPSATAIQPAYRLDQSPGQGVVIGVYSFDTQGFEVIDPKPSDATALIYLSSAGASSMVYSLPFAEPERDASPYVLPFYVSLPSGTYSFGRTDRPIPSHVRVLVLGGGGGVVDTPQWATFDVEPGAVTCIGHVHLRVRLSVQLTGGVRPTAGRWEVTDNCERLTATFQRMYPDVGGTVRRALARR